MFRIVLLICATLNTCFASETSWSSKLGLPPGTDEDLAKEFYIHKDAIGSWIRSLDGRSRAGQAPLVNCPLCQTAVNLGLSLIHNNDSNSAELSLIQLCNNLNIFPAEFCEGALHRYMPPASFIATERPYITATDACAILVQGGSCGYPNETLSNWEIFIEGNKPSVFDPVPYPEGHPTAKILHLSDMHLDLKYVENSHGNCGDPLCCRKPVPENTTAATLAGPFGDYHCDIPLGAMSNLLEDAASRYNYSFVLVTGNFGPHAIWDSTKDDNMRNFDVVTNRLNELFPNIPIYPVLGNQEPHPYNMFAPRSVWNATEGDFNLDWMYDRIATLYERHLPSDAAASLRSRGFYTLVTPQGVRIVALNTNICFVFNFWLLYDTVDPEGQLQWFSDTLASAERAGEMVYVLGHMPPGYRLCWSTWTAQFNKIINRYAHLIKGQFYGHTQEDGHKIFFETSSTQLGPVPRPTSFGFVGPSVSPFDNVNPAFKVYQVDGAVSSGTWEIFDHETYYYDVSLANKEGKTTVKKLCSAREAYGLKSLKPEDLYDLVVRMVKDDELFQLWYKHLSRVSPTAAPCEDSTCRMSILCNTVTTDYGDQGHCDRLKSMLNE